MSLRHFYLYHKFQTLMPAYLIGKLSRFSTLKKLNRYFLAKEASTRYEAILMNQRKRLLMEKRLDSSKDFIIFLHVNELNKKYLHGALESITQQKIIGIKLYIVYEAGDRENYSQLTNSSIDINFLESFDEIREQVSQLNDNTFILFMSCSGQLNELACRKLMSIAESNSESKLIYFDEDFILTNNKSGSPLFKPSWNRDLLYSQNYIGDCFLIKSVAIKNALKGRDDYFNAYSVLLELSNLYENDEIIHSPFVLFHRYQSYVNIQSKDDLTIIRDFFRNRNMGANIEKSKVVHHRIKWNLPKRQPLVSIIIPTRNSKSLVKQCIETIYQRTTYLNFEIILVDNQSDDPPALAYFELLNAEGRVRLLKYDKAFNYSAINNFAVQAANGSVISLLNNDIEVISPGWLTEMVSQACRPEIGCVGAKLFYPNDTIQHAGVIIGYGGVAGHAFRLLPRESSGYMNRLNVVQNYSAVTAACLVVKKEIYNLVGGLNEKELTVAFNDVDFCLKVQAAGYRNLWTPFAELYHHESLSRGEDTTAAKKARFEQEILYMKRVWQTDVVSDPAYNPNLALNREDFSVR